MKGIIFWADYFFLSTATYSAHLQLPYLLVYNTRMYNVHLYFQIGKLQNQVLVHNMLQDKYNITVKNNDFIVWV